MASNRGNSVFLGCLLIILLVGYSCIPTFDTYHAETFKNCTRDTIYIGVSHYSCIDSIDNQFYPHYNIQVNGSVDTADVSLWNHKIQTYEYGSVYIKPYNDCFILPDSLCDIDGDYLFQDTDTCYFFLVRLQDTKRYTWDEIRKLRTYRQRVITRGRDGAFDKNIR